MYHTSFEVHPLYHVSLTLIQSLYYPNPQVMDDFAQNIDAVHAGEELKPRFSFPEGFMSSQGGSDKDKGSDMFSDRDRGWDKSSDREGFPGLGLGLGQESAVSAAMMNVPVVTLEYADTMSLQHLHTLFERRMAVRKGSDIPSPGPVAKSPAHYTTSPTQHTSSLTGFPTQHNINPNPTIILKMFTQ